MNLKEMCTRFEKKMLKAVQRIYVHSYACVRVRMDLSEWFPVNVGLRKGVVIFSWLFN